MFGKSLEARFEKLEAQINQLSKLQKQQDTLVEHLGLKFTRVPPANEYWKLEPKEGTSE